MTDPFERAVLRDEVADQEVTTSRFREGFVIHAVVFVAVNILLVVVNVVTWTGYPWFVYPLLGWGIGLAAHGAAYRNQVRRERAAEAKLRQR
jgi:hypothetical protein